MKEVIKIWKLNSPSMCREFLKQVRTGNGGTIDYLEQADGTRVSIDDAKDEQVIEAANIVAEAMGKK